MSVLGPNPSFFLLLGTFIHFGGLLGQGLGVEFGPGIDPKKMFQNYIFLNEISSIPYFDDVTHFVYDVPPFDVR